MKKEKEKKKAYNCDECGKNVGVIYKVGDSWLCESCFEKGTSE